MPSVQLADLLTTFQTALKTGNVHPVAVNGEKQEQTPEVESGLGQAGNGLSLRLIRKVSLNLIACQFAHHFGVTQYPIFENQEPLHP